MEVPVWEGIGKLTWYFCEGVCWVGTIVVGYMLIRTLIAYIRGY